MQREFGREGEEGAKDTERVEGERDEETMSIDI